MYTHRTALLGITAFLISLGGSAPLYAQLFYRSGEPVEVRENVQPAQLPEASENPFDTPTEEAVPPPEEQTAPAEPAVAPAIEEGTGEALPTEEPTLEAAPSKASGFASLAKMLRYVSLAIILGGAVVFVLLRKKPRIASNVIVENTPVPVPENPQNVEESSARLTHALEAMEVEPKEE